ncbi:MAG: glucose 1-dehydrogenase [Anaerolineae bacterium]|jgi:glucose 1-dehydrogenase
MRLEGKVAVVTGAGGGIGKGIVLRLAEEGADVVLVDLDQAGAQAVAQEVENMGRRALVLPTDVSDATSVNTMVTRTLEWGGHIDILVNNAGVELIRPFFEISEGDWDKTMDVNLKGAWLCSQAVARVMADAKNGGRIINVGSIMSEMPAPGEPHYAASKGGILMLTKAMALDLAPYDINVNAIGPGVIKNGLSSKGCLSDPATAEKIKAGIPLRRFGSPRDIGNAVAFLSSAEANYVTGVIIYVDGGVILASPWS